METENTLRYLVSLVTNEITPILGGGLHYAFYTEALSIELTDRGFDVKRKGLNILYQDKILGTTPIDINFTDSDNLKWGIIVTANSSIVEKDRQLLDRMIRFGNYDRVACINIDWYGNILFEYRPSKFV